jgi:Tol biopolymer transport system component
MDADRWKEISALYASALERPPAERGAFVVAMCKDDLDLREQVELLLANHDDAQDTLTSPAAEVLARTLAAETVSLVGRQLGAYRIDAPLASGGMGEVYRATDTRLHRTVALKILPSQVRDDPALRQRFEREAQAIAALRHPHICVLHDVGHAEGIDFLVLELLEGETIAERLRRGPLPLDEALRYGLEIAEALVAIHRQETVHRDLKPGNVMLTESGAKLLDFGLAKVRESATAGAAGPSPSGVLSMGTSTAAGTLPYMTPEQLARREVDHRSDIFAFGTLLYEMLTGGKAFDGTSRDEIAAAILDRHPPPLPASFESMAPGVRALIDRCLRKNPNERWQDAAVMARDLQRIAADAAHRAGPSGRRRRMVAAIGGILLAAIGAFWIVGRDQDSTLWSGGPVVVGATRQLSGSDEIEMDPAISPNGELIAYSAGRGNSFRIVIRSLISDSVLPAPSFAQAQFHPQWSPDGSRLLYLTRDGVFVSSVNGGEPVRIAAPAEHKGVYSTSVPSMSQITGAAWSPAGDEIGVAYGGLLMGIATDGRRRQIAAHAYELHWCDWSFTGWIACASGNPHLTLFGPNLGNLAPSAIVLVRAADGHVVEVAPRTALNRSPVWSADGRRLYFVSEREGPGDVYRVDIGEDGVPRGEAARVTTGLGAYSIDISGATDTLAYTQALARGNIWSLPIPTAGTLADAAAAKPVTTGNQIIEAMHVTPDGRWLLFDSNRYGHSDIFRVPLDGGETTRLTTAPSDEFGPAVSRDGRWLAYFSWRTKSRDVFVQPFEGGAVEQVTATPGQEAYPQWLPDHSLAFTDLASENGVLRGVFVTRRQPGDGWVSPRRLLPPDTGGPAYARNGSILYLSPKGIHLRRPGAEDAQLLYTWAPGKARPARVVVSDDDTSVYFKSHDAEGRASFWSLPLSGGTPRLLVRLDDVSRPSRRFDFTAGGGRIFFTIEERRSNIWLATVVRSTGRGGE